MSIHRSSLFSSRLLCEDTNSRPTSSLANHYTSQLLITSTPILVADVLALILAVCGSDYAASLVFQDWVSLPGTSITFLVTSTMLMYAALGLYPGLGINPIYEFRQCLSGAGAGLVLAYGISTETSNQLSLLVAVPLILLIASIARPTLRYLLSRTSWWGMRCLVFGSDDKTDTFYSRQIKDRSNGLRPVGSYKVSCHNSQVRNFAMVGLATIATPTG